MAQSRQDEQPGSTSPPEPDARLLEALLASVAAVHGERIGPERMERVRESIKGLRTAAEALAAYPLTNADEPDPIFAAYRAED